ncbi:hypothetical protein V6N12_052234 [Hibiscus sabdariffa]|uniref:Uncharacterized protein n=1 Tax=Hibiscus sabdariffa TaxID=183260 RepID=A0ABR2GHM7_9ROSI
MLTVRYEEHNTRQYPEVLTTSTVLLLVLTGFAWFDLVNSEVNIPSRFLRLLCTNGTLWKTYNGEAGNRKLIDKKLVGFIEFEVPVSIPGYWV